MKKIFTLVFAVGFLTAAAQAQPGSRDNRDKPQSDQRAVPQYDQRNDQPNSQWDKNNSYSKNTSYGKSVEMQVAQINRKYDMQIQRVKSDFSMRRFEKTRMLRSLENQRQQEIKMLYKRAGDTRLYDRGYNSNQHK